MTEDEAKKKWCPFARVIGDLDENAAANRWPEDDSKMWAGPNGNPHSLCIASACMAWRWITIKEEPSEGHPLGISIVHGGYCGLAGTLK